MKKLIIGATACLMTIGMMPSQAQDGPPQFRPVEMWVCSFLDGKDQDDMDDVYEELVELTGDARYAAWQLTPYYTGNLARNADLIYLGAWDTASVMGADLANYFANGQDAVSAWDETVDCQGLMFASNEVQANPPADGGDGTFMLTVSDCKVEHGNTAAQAVGAISRFNDYRVANGVTIGTFVWFPLFGGGDAEFDFKLAQAYSGPQALGDSLQWMIDSAAYNVRNSISQGVVSCDESRVYNGMTIMNNISAN